VLNQSDNLAALEQVKRKIKKGSFKTPVPVKPVYGGEEIKPECGSRGVQKIKIGITAFPAVIPALFIIIVCLAFTIG